MNSQDATLTCTLHADLSEIAALGDAIAQWGERLQIPPDAVSAMTLMLEELISNSITHGYAENGTTGDVSVRLETDGKALMACVIDAAPAFNPLALAPPDTAAALEDRQVGGLGVHLVRRLAHSADYQRVDDRNIVRVGRNFASSE